MGPTSSRNSRVFAHCNFLLFICLLSRAYLWRGNSVCDALGGGGGDTQHCDCISPEIIASLPTAWFEQTWNTHAEQSCQRNMSQTAHQVGASGTEDGELPSDAAASLSVSSASLENSAAKGGRKKQKQKRSFSRYVLLRSTVLIN